MIMENTLDGVINLMNGFVFTIQEFNQKILWQKSYI